MYGFIGVIDSVADILVRMCTQNNADVTNLFWLPQSFNINIQRRLMENQLWGRWCERCSCQNQWKNFSHACQPCTFDFVTFPPGLMRHKQAAIERNWGRKVWTLSDINDVCKIDVMQPQLIASGNIFYANTDIEYHEQLQACKKGGQFMPNVHNHA